MSAESVEAIVAGQVDGIALQFDSSCEQLLRVIRERHRTGIAAVLVYGSYLRGKRNTPVDFYVLLDGYGALRPAWQAILAWLLSPNVYQVRAGQGPDEIRAKYAVMTLDRFERAIRRDPHPYFWARFAQPVGLVYCRNRAFRERVIAALAQANRRFTAAVVPRLCGEFTAADLIRRGLQLSYGCELRSEPVGHAAALASHNDAYYASVLRCLAQEQREEQRGFGPAGGKGRYRATSGPWRRRWSGMAWALRRLQGKPKSVLRLLKAALTFDDGLDYLLWKVACHSGHYIEPTQLQRRYPLLFAWPLLWRLYRRGAFR